MGKDEVEAAIVALEATIWRLDTWVLAFAIILFVGLTGETVLGVAHWLKDRQLRPLRALQAQLHEKELGDLNRGTEELRQKNLLLEEAISPRILDQSRYEELRRYSGLTALIRHVPEYEPRRMAEQISFLLKQAGWTVQMLPTEPELADGIEIVAEQPVGSIEVLGSNRLAEDGARAVAEQIKASKIDALSGPIRRALPLNVIRISVGIKPDPIMKKQFEELLKNPNSRPPGNVIRGNRG